MRVTRAIQRRFQSSPLEARLIAGAYWTLLGSAAARGATLIASIILARILGRDVFGEFGAIDSTIGMFAVFGSLGLTVSTTKLLSQHRGGDPHTAGRILALSHIYAAVTGAIAALAMAISAGWLARHTLAASHLATDLRLGSGVLLFSAVNGTVLGALTAFQAFRAIAKIGVLTAALSIPTLVAGAILGGVDGAVGALVVTQSASCVLQLVALRRSARAHGIRFEWGGCWSEHARIINVSVPAFISSSLNAPINWLCAALLINFGGGYAQLGLLQVVNTWFLAMMFIPGRLGQVYYPMLEELVAHGQSASAVRFLWKIIGISALLFGAAALCIHLSAGLILSFYGPQYADARLALVVTAWTAALAAAAQPLSIFVLAMSRMWSVVACSASAAAVTALATFLLVEDGALGFVLARLIATAAAGAVATVFVYRAIAKQDQKSELQAEPQATKVTVGRLQPGQVAA
jgi:O-antigen/teichoic acid export membrane protein